VFPADPTERCFSGTAFNGNAKFNNATFQGKCSFTSVAFESVDFTGAKFMDRVDFRDVTFKGTADFGKENTQAANAAATFEGDVFIAGTVFMGWTVFSGAVFCKTFHCADTTFRDEVLFRHAKFSDDVTFTKTQFESDALFDSSQFDSHLTVLSSTFKGSASFKHARVGGLASFNRTEIDYGRFDGAEFHGNAIFFAVSFFAASFKGTLFEGYAGLDTASCTRQFTVILPPSDSPTRIKPGLGTSLYRLAKQCAMSNGDYRLAGDFHYAEQCAAEYGRRQLSTWNCWKPDFWTRGKNAILAWLEYLIGRSLFGYGERPQRVVVAAFIIILVFTFVFSWSHGVGYYNKNHEWLEVTDFTTCLYFSITTFTTVGFGDVLPAESTFVRYMAATESMLGATLMALFIVALARRYTR
jgi:uncharacterized protein YjbI with pentapeptide repeats